MHLGETSILVVQFSESFASLWKQLAGDLGFGVRLADGADGRAVPRDAVAVVLAAGGVEREALEWLGRHEVSPAIPVIAVGSDPDRRIAIRLVAQGASDYFALPEDVELLRSAVQSAVARRRQALEREGGAARTQEKAEAFSAIVGESAALKAALARAARVLPHADATALIVGETGTGKELLAHAIHEGGPRRRSPFVTVNCSVLPPHLIESELFGHERGAFTDAHAAKPGLFEVADGGTLFLDEIGTLALDLQAKLLRVLEDKEVRRVGATKSRSVDVRVIAATNQNPREAIRAGTFREDLYFRLNVITLSLPPLRERGQDALLIAEYLLGRMATRHGLPVPPFTPEIGRALLAHQWPGNVRELKNALERALLLSPPGELSLAELVPDTTRAERDEDLASPVPGSLEAVMAAAARSALETCGRNRSEAARRLGISRRRLRRLLNRDACG